jgi:hypothetical protein
MRDPANCSSRTHDSYVFPAMKWALALLLCIGFAANAPASVRVGPPPVFRLARQRSKITVLFNGAPLAKTTLLIYLNRNVPAGKRPLSRQLKFVTNSSGTFTLPHLHWGCYVVFVRARPNVSGGIALAIAPPAKSPHYAPFVARIRIRELLTTLEATPAASFQLTLTRHRGPTQKQILAIEEHFPAFKILAFHGMIQDPVGTPIPHAAIEIYRFDSSQNGVIKSLKSNQQGNFSAHLPDGDYLVTFTYFGFGKQTLHVVISNKAGNHPLKIIMLPAVTQ